jgi:hypothetical protein
MELTALQKYAEEEIRLNPGDFSRMPLTLPTDAKIHTIYLPRNDDNDWTTRYDYRQISYEMPRWTDVTQGHMGNCFALAAIIAIACRDGGPQFIQNMMKDDEGDIYFVGRLWDPQKTKYRYIKARKAICIRTGKGDPASGHNALWVSAIEIMLSCFDGWKFKGGLTYDPSNAAWSRLDGGQEYNVLLCMTGRQPEKHSIPDPVSDDFDLGADLMDFGTFRYGSETFKDFQKGVSTGELSWEVEDPAGKEFLEKHKDDIKVAWQNFLGGQGGRVLRREKFNELFLTPLLLKYQRGNVPASVVSYLWKVSRELSGKRRLARYSTGDEVVYNKINGWCREGKAVAAGTRKILSSKRQYGNAAGGEQMVKGLLGGHAYAVSGCSEREGHKYVRMINPWGYYVRSYEPVTLRPSSLLNYQARSRPPVGVYDHGEFDLHLLDFTKAFESVCAVNFH